MQPVSRLFAVLAAVSYLASCAPPPPPEPPKPLETPEQMIASAKAVDEAFIAGFNKADGDAVAATYWNSPETVSYLPDVMELKGFEAIKAGLVQSMPAMGGAQLQITEARYVPVGEDTVLSNGLWTMTMPAAEGAAPAEMRGRFSAVMQRKDGRWVYIMDHASMPMAPPPGADAASAADAAPAAAPAK